MTQATFSISDRAVDEVTHVIAAAGELDLQAAPELRDTMIRLIESGKYRLVVDLSEATFLDSSVIGVLVARTKQLHASGGALALVCVHESILRTFEITGLDRVLPIRTSPAAALTALAWQD